MSMIEDRLGRLEDHIKRLGLGCEMRAANMSPAERRTRILELMTEEVGLGRVPSQEEYEAWLLETYHTAAFAPAPPPWPDTRLTDSAELDEEERRGIIEAYRGREAWEILQRCKAHNPMNKEEIVFNGATQRAD